MAQSAQPPGPASGFFAQTKQALPGVCLLTAVALTAYFFTPILHGLHPFVKKSEPQ